MSRYYRVIVASTKGGLHVAAPAEEGWTILQNTIKEFTELDSNHDRSLGNVGQLLVKKKGWLALAYIDA